MRRTWLAGLVLAIAAFGVGWAEVTPGEMRSVQSKAGAALRRDPSGLGAVVATMPYGARAEILQVQGAWARVRTTSGEGWMRAADLVEPATLTGGGAFGPRPGGAGAAPATGAAGVSATEVSAAGRQFDEAVEGGYRAANPNLQAAFAQLDGIERTKPTPAEIEAFIRAGRLGR
jgi:hypothetical protein